VAPGGVPDDGGFDGDSDRYPRDSTPDSETDSTLDSEADSNGYQSEEADEFDEGLRPLIEQWKSMREGWWNQAGYETYWDLVKEDEAGWQRMGFRSIYDKRRKRPKTAELPDPTPPEIDMDALAADATRPRRRRECQVNVRLTQLGYDALREAARGYGLRPTTLARLLIHRGAIAVLERQKD
jgi:hypothetical protein